jgi:hypothetical protein
MENVVNAIAAAPQSQALLTKLAELEAHKERLTARLKEDGATQRRPFQPVSVEKVLANWQRMREVLHDGEVSERREKVRLFVREWWIDPDTHTMGAVFSHPLEVCHSAVEVVAPQRDRLNEKRRLVKRTLRLVGGRGTGRRV